MPFCSLLFVECRRLAPMLLYLSIIAEMTQSSFPSNKKYMKTIGVKYEIYDIDTGECLLEFRCKTVFTHSGIYGIDSVRERFLKFVSDGRNVSVCVTCFDSRYNMDDIENIFIRNKHIEGIF